MKRMLNVLLPLLCIVLLFGCTPRRQLIQEPMTQTVTVEDFEITLSTEGADGLSNGALRYGVEIRYLGAEPSLQLSYCYALSWISLTPTTEGWTFPRPEPLCFTEIRQGESLSSGKSLPDAQKLPVGEYTVHIPVDFTVVETGAPVHHVFEIPLAVTKPGKN